MSNWPKTKLPQIELNMTTVYKITDTENRSHGNWRKPTFLHWGPGIEHTASGKGKLCKAGWIHAYPSLLVAALRKEADLGFRTFHIWESDADVGTEGQGKLGCTRLKTIRLLEVPEITARQKCRFLCGIAFQLYKDEKWQDAAKRFFAGKETHEDRDYLCSYGPPGKSEMRSNWGSRWNPEKLVENVEPDVVVLAEWATTDDPVCPIAILEKKP